MRGILCRSLTFYLRDTRILHRSWPRVIKFSTFGSTTVCLGNMLSHKTRIPTTRQPKKSREFSNNLKAMNLLMVVGDGNPLNNTLEANRTLLRFKTRSKTSCQLIFCKNTLQQTSFCRKLHNSTILTAAIKDCFQLI